MPKPTLKAVAELAGVSIGTASAAMNNRPTVSTETQMRVFEAALTLGYAVKRPFEMESVDAKLSIIGLLMMHSPGQMWAVNPFYSRIQLGVTNQCNHKKMSMMFASVEVDSSGQPIAWPVMITEQHVDGLILAGDFSEEVLSSIKHRLNVPMVLVGSHSPGFACDSIVADNLGGGRQAVLHLIEQNHQKIGLVGWNPLAAPSIQDRYLGYVGSLAIKGYEPYIQPSPATREGGYQAAKQLLTKYPEITAIFACSDQAGLGVLQAAREMGRQVPTDFSVMGFGDIELAHELEVALTTIHMHKSWMGAMAVDLLIERARNPRQPIVKKIVSTFLIERDTVE